MSKILLTTVILLLPALVSADRLIRIPAVTDSDFTEIQALGYEMTSGSRAQGFVDVFVAERYVEETLIRHPEARLLPLEWSQPLPRDDRNEFGYYYGPNENAAFWATLAQNSDLVDTPATFGQSWEGRDLYYIRITNASPSAPVIFFTALQHAREPGGNSVVIDWGQWLATEYGSDTMATFILDNAQIYIVPVSNPDGYHYNLPSGGPNHRKNRNTTDPVASSGIDLNRNWSYMWGYDDTGSSPNPYSETYRGSAPLSEPENYHLAALMQDLQPLGGFHYHTYGGYLLYPWGYNNQATPDQTTFQSWSAQMTSQNNYQYGRAGEILYMVNGEANDWAYGELNSLFFCPEVDDNGFWGSQNDTSLIVTNNLECRYMNKLLCMNLLAMVDIKVQTSAETGHAPVGISLSGNPVESVLGYSVAGTQNQTVEILDMAGRTVGSTDSGIWQVPSSLTNGIYFVRATGGNEAVTERFTILR